MNLLSLASPDIQRILDKALSGIKPTRDELRMLLELDPRSSAADLLRMTGRRIALQRFGHRAMLLCQTGVETFPCPADCTFCSFGQSVNHACPWRIAPEKLSEINAQLCAMPGTYAHFLLFMHTFDFAYLLSTVEQSRKELPEGISIVLNCGDLDAVQIAELKAAGASGAYHVVRLGEGIDTKLTVEQRVRTIELLKEAGMDWYTCCEPIGPEHSNEELLDRILLSADLECFQNAVMRRVAVPGTPLASRGQITLLRSAQIVAVVLIAMQENKVLSSLAIHEPDLLGLTSGANCIYAEFGANPRDLEAATEKGRGHSPEWCRAMLKDCGYTALMQSASCEDIPF